LNSFPVLKWSFACFLGLLLSSASMAAQPSRAEIERLREALRRAEGAGNGGPATGTVRPGPRLRPARRGHAEDGDRGGKPGEAEGRQPVREPQESEKPTAFQRYVRGEDLAGVSTELAHFGYDLFKGGGREFRPVTSVAAGPDYVVGPGDEVIVRIWGKVELEAAAEVDRGGKLALPKVGVFAVAGRTLARVRKDVRARYDKVYKDYQLDVSLGELRRIGVFVVGRVRKPGRYAISSVGTVLNALMAAGGPASTGSLRDITVRRKGKVVATFDVYDLMTAGRRTGDIRLQPEDTVFVGACGRRVAVAGGVRNPAIYELTKAEMTLTKLLALAGGLEPTAARDRVQIERIGDGGKVRLEEIDLARAGGDFALSDGDVVRVFSVIRKTANVVYLAGNVARPGAFRFRKGMRVSDLIGDLQMLVPEKAWRAGRAPVQLDPNTGKPVEPAGLEDDRRRKSGRRPTEPKSRAGRRSKSRDSALKKATGRAGRDGETPGGEPKDGAEDDEEDGESGGKPVLFPEPFWKHALIRRISRPRLEVRYIPFDLGKALLEKKRGSDPLLASGDTVIVFSKWDFVKRPMVRIGGAVNRPGAYALTPGMSLRDLVGIAGGLKPYAYRSEAELLRVHYDEKGQREERMLVKLGRELAGKGAEKPLALRERDHLFVRSIPEHKPAATVTLAGEVRFPGTYPVRKGEKLSSLIRRAGGYTDQAYLAGAEFTRESVRKLQQERLDQMLARLETELSRSAAAAAQKGLGEEAVKAAGEQAAWQTRLLGQLRAAKAKGRVVVRLAAVDSLAGSPSDLVLEKGDFLRIPRRPNTVNVLGSTHNQNAYIWNGKATYRYYLKMAGGPTKYADRKGIYVIRADGSVASLRQGGRGVRWDAERRRWVSGGLKGMPLQPGDTIVVPEELDHVAWLRNTKDITQILYQIAVATGVVIMAF